MSPQAKKILDSISKGSLPSGVVDGKAADVTGALAVADGDAGVGVMSTLSSEFSRSFFFRIFSAAVSCVGDFHILLNGRNAMLSGRSGPAVAEKRLPELKIKPSNKF